MKVLAIVLLCGLLAGCSASAESYADVDAVAAALRDGEIPCDDVVQSPAADIVSDQGTCKAEGDEHDIFVFDDEAERDRWLEIGGGLGEVVVGPNWVVISGGDADRVADALGGEIR